MRNGFGAGVGYGDFRQYLGDGRGAGHFNCERYTSGTGHWNSDDGNGEGVGVDHGYNCLLTNAAGYGALVTPILMPAFVTHTDDLRGAAIEAAMREVRP